MLIAIPWFLGYLRYAEMHIQTLEPTLVLSRHFLVPGVFAYKFCYRK